MNISYQMCYIHVVDQYLSMKKERTVDMLLPENTMLNERSQSQKSTYLLYASMYMKCPEEAKMVPSSLGSGAWEV